MCACLHTQRKEKQSGDEEKDSVNREIQRDVKKKDGSGKETAQRPTESLDEMLN